MFKVSWIWSVIVSFNLWGHKWIIIKQNKGSWALAFQNWTYNLCNKLMINFLEARTAVVGTGNTIVDVIVRGLPKKSGCKSLPTLPASVKKKESAVLRWFNIYLIVPQFDRSAIIVKNLRFKIYIEVFFHFYKWPFNTHPL